MTSGDSQKCPHCGALMRFDALYCPNCGHARVEVSKSPTALVILMVFFGIIVAVPVWYVLSLLAMQFLDNVGVPPGPRPEFSVSWPAAAFFVVVTLLAIAGLIFQARARLSPPARSFIIAFLSVVLGLFSICDIFALSNRV